MVYKSWLNSCEEWKRYSSQFDHEILLLTPMLLHVVCLQHTAILDMDKDTSIFGIFDGHGGANLVSYMLH